MSLTLLVDLDDTLLVNSMRTFMPAYRQSLSRQLAPFVDPEPMLAALNRGTMKMILNTRPDCTLQEVFNASFFPDLKISPDVVRPAIQQFYNEVFPSLQPVTHPLPGAVAFIEEAFARGYRVAIATNPLFPRQAILHRLAWAGLPVDKYPFDLIPSYETFHFAKPSPAYYTELLARMGWQDGPVVMVGNDPTNDIAGSRQAGLAAFWVTQPGSRPPGDAAPNAQGTLVDVFPWIDSQAPESLEPIISTPSAMLAVLRSTPAALEILIRDLPHEKWGVRPEPGEWALNEVLCHLRDVEGEVNLPRVKKVLQETNPFLPGMDTDPWAEERAYIAQSCPQALFRFLSARMELLDLLESASPQDWQRTARHAIFGPTSLMEIISIIAGHDRIHIHQVDKILTALKND